MGEKKKLIYRTDVDKLESKSYNRLRSFHNKDIENDEEEEMLDKVEKKVKQ